jgi:nitrogen fixation/metabolism regulation signal transduction histidine kinase
VKCTDVKGIVVKPEDDLNLAVYNKTAEELFKKPVNDEIDSELNACPRTLTRYTGPS